jgi:hypothetical protein
VEEFKVIPFPFPQNGFPDHTRDGKYLSEKYWIASYLLTFQLAESNSMPNICFFNLLLAVP